MALERGHRTGVQERSGHLAVVGLLGVPLDDSPTELGDLRKRAAESRIRDANVAEESANMSRFNILSQSGIAALSQANQQSSSILSLLR